MRENFPKKKREFSDEDQTPFYIFNARNGILTSRCLKKIGLPENLYLKLIMGIVSPFRPKTGETKSWVKRLCLLYSCTLSDLFQSDIAEFIDEEVTDIDAYSFLVGDYTLQSSKNPHLRR